jgi:titin
MTKRNHASQQRYPGRTYRAAAVSAVIEGLENRTLLSTYTVTNTNDSGGGSLRQAITDANNHAGADVIHFAIGSGAKTISPSKSLPGLGDGTTLDATSQPGYAGKPLVTINGTSAGASTDGLKISGTGVTVRGLVIKNFGGSGMLIVGKGSNHVAGNYIGTDGTNDAGNKAHGILVQSPNNTIGGATASDRNVISGNGLSGVFLYTTAATGNTVAGNFIGTDATGTRAIANSKNGVQINGAPRSTVGGTRAGARNILSGNTNDGVLIISAGSQQNAVLGNYIGTDVSGTKRLGNGWYGVEISQPNNVVGGASQGAGNVVSANVYGGVVMFLSTSYGNRVQGNFIGTDYTGTKDLGNVGRGLEFTNGAHDNVAGGTKFAERNVISGNDLGGVGFYSGSSMNAIHGNYIGTTADGEHALPNTGAGVMVTDSAGINFIGGRYKFGNLISGNTHEGIYLGSGTKGSIVQGNKIGTDAAGTLDLGNATDGIYVGSNGNQIGGRLRGMGNLVSGNNGNGIYLNNTSGNYVGRNSVGTDGSGKKKLANTRTGIVMSHVSKSIVRQNMVAYNGGYGLKANSSTGNAVSKNTVINNDGPEIDMGS